MITLNGDKTITSMLEILKDPGPGTDDVDGDITFRDSYKPQKY